ncbi:hypothetical protein IFR04_011250 [Cadophora malorum]|uniref:Uncharacterized protein n=1 Tax=Cadophora malorum TaxID=108018 RepID=A0A8H7T9W3_9HELO|nr:hypothetical protein IFR04_011250 [Cadophora malorum]
MPADEKFLRLSRSGFSFFKLPRDVRDLIYGYLVEPFRDPSTHCTEVAVGLVHLRRCHPFRNGYAVTAPPADPGPSAIYSQHSTIDYGLQLEDYEMLRACSQVNHQLRAELGAAFWSNVYIDIDHWEYLLVDFLEDRPAVWKGVKRLRMEWNCGSPYWLDDKIVKFCEYVSDHLDLDELLLVLSTTPSVARYLLSHDDVEWVKAFRKMKFKKLRIKLDLETELASEPDEENGHVVGDMEEIVGLQTDDELDGGDNMDSAYESSDGSGSDQDSEGGFDSDWMDSEEEAEAARETLTSELTPLLEALLQPQVPTVGATEEERYLEARALLVALPTKEEDDEKE